MTVQAYVLVPSSNPAAASVKCIEHGHLIDEPTAKLLDKGIWWSLEPFLNDQDASPLVNPLSQKKALQVFARTDNAYMEDIKLIENPAKNFVVIMKDGKIYKNLLRNKVG